MTDPVPLLQWIRGMCSDEEPHHLIDAKLAEVIELIDGSDDPLTDEANALIVNELLRGSPLERAYAEAMRGLEHYASEGAWLNYREYRGFPGRHAASVALVAIERATAERNGETSGASVDTVGGESA